MLYQRKDSTAQQGVSLVSLLISMTIVAVVSALSVPSYMDYLQRKDIQQVRHKLMTWQAEQIRYRLGNDKYASTAELSSVSVADYVFSVVAVTATDYTLQAKRTRALNDGCDTLTVTGSGSYLPAKCWR